MKTYWDNTLVADVVLSLAMSSVFWLLPPTGATIIFVVPASSLNDIGRDFVAVTSGLLGLTAATVAFIASAYSSSRFDVLRKSKAKRWFWDVFVHTLIYQVFGLCCALVACFISTDLIFIHQFYIISTAVVLLNTVAMIKFIWVLSHVLRIQAD